MESPSLADRVRESLARDNRPASLRVIAEAADVDYDWLLKFTHGHIDDPGIRKVEAVAAALTRMASAA
jgi:hypothetical protein